MVWPNTLSVGKNHLILVPFYMLGSLVFQEILACFTSVAPVSKVSAATLANTREKYYQHVWPIIVKNICWKAVRLAYQLPNTLLFIYLKSSTKIYQSSLCSFSILELNFKTTMCCRGAK